MNSIVFKKICKEQDFEICGIACKLEIGYIIILSCYRLPSGNNDVFLKNIYNVLSKVFKSGAIIFFCGDFNADSYNKKSNEFLKILKVLKCFILKHTIRCPTFNILGYKN